MELKTLSSIHRTAKKEKRKEKGSVLHRKTNRPL
jgi:hypothetical protein